MNFCQLCESGSKLYRIEMFETMKMRDVIKACGLWDGGHGCG